jgi:hypothetical protein
MFRRACVNTGAIFPSRKITLNFVFFKKIQNKSKTWKEKSTHEVEERERERQGQKQGSARVHLRVCCVPYTHALEYTQTHPLGPQGPSSSSSFFL